MINFSFTPQKKDYRKAYWSFYSNNGVFKVAAFLYLPMPICWLSNPENWAQDIWFPILLLLLPVLICGFIVVIHLANLRKLDEYGYFKNIIQGSANDDEILFKNELGETRLNWKNFHKTIETEDAFWLTYEKNKNAFQIVPKRAFASEDEIRAFKDHLRSKILNYELRIKAIKKKTQAEIPGRSKVVWAIFAICILILVIQAILNRIN